MKIRNARLIRAAGWLGAQVARGLIRSQRFEYRHTGPAVLPPPPEPGPRYIYLLWHEYLLLPLTKYACPLVGTLVSRHADGQVLANLIHALGCKTVHGSTNRGGIQAVREIIRDVAGCRHMAITPDGPRGPRRVAQSGAIYLAAKTGMKIAPLGLAYQRPWRAKSWDRFAVPKVFFRAKMVSGEPFDIPSHVRTDTLEQYRVKVQAEMDRLTAVAEHWAETNRYDESVTP